MHIVPTLHIIYASTSGHTQYVIETVAAHLQANGFTTFRVMRAEEASPEDFTNCDALLLACGTWNTGGVEGQLDVRMHMLLHGVAKGVELSGKKCTLIALGDERYYYTTRSNEHLRKFFRDRGGDLFVQPLLVVNEPYGQEAKIEKWADKLLTALQQ